MRVKFSGEKKQSWADGTVRYQKVNYLTTEFDNAFRTEI